VRAPPSWLITEDDDHVDIDLGNLKTGKEAEVFVIERRATTPAGTARSCLLAHKRYRPRAVTHKGELEALGFQRAANFVNDAAYRDGRNFANSRDRRAAATKTRYGRTLLNKGWAGRELEAMRSAWEAGANVPYPVGEMSDGLLMQYVGDSGGAAPRLAQARLTRAQLERAHALVSEQLQLLLDAGIVHADFSAYNLLWWQDAVWLIDFPQAVDVGTNLGALELLQRDVENISRFFDRHGVGGGADELYGQLISRWQGA